MTGFPPREFALEEMEVRRWTLAHLAERSGLDAMHLADFLAGRTEYTPVIGGGLARAFGTSGVFWDNLDRLYRVGR